MIKLTILYIVMFFAVFGILLGIIWLATPAMADSPPCVDQTTGQPCPPRGDRMGGSCMEGVGGHLTSIAGWGDWMLIGLAIPVVGLVLRRWK